MNKNDENKNVIPFPNETVLESNVESRDKNEQRRQAVRREQKRRADNILIKLKKSTPSEITIEDAITIAKNLGNIFQTHKPKNCDLRIKDLFLLAFENPEIFEAKYKKRTRFVRFNGENFDDKKKGSIAKSGVDFCALIIAMYSLFDSRGNISSDLKSIFVLDAVRGTNFDDKPKQYSENNRDFSIYEFIKKIEEKIIRETSVVDYFFEIYKTPTQISKTEKDFMFKLDKQDIDEYLYSLDNEEAFEDSEYVEYNDLFPNIDIGKIFYEVKVPHFTVDDPSSQKCVESYLENNGIDFDQPDTFSSISEIELSFDRLLDSIGIDIQKEKRKSLDYNGIYKSIWEAYVVKMGVKPIYDNRGNVTVKLFIYTTTNPDSHLNYLTIDPSIDPTIEKLQYGCVHTVNNLIWENFSHKYQSDDECYVSFGSKIDRFPQDPKKTIGLGKITPAGFLYEFHSKNVYVIYHSVFVNGYITNSDSDYSKEYYDEVCSKAVISDSENERSFNWMHFGISNIDLYLNQKVDIIEGQKNKINLEATGYRVSYLYDKGQVYFNPFFDTNDDEYTPFNYGTLGSAFINNITYFEGDDNIVNRLINVIDFYTEKHESFIKNIKNRFFEKLQDNDIDH